MTTTAVIQSADDSLVDQYLALELRTAGDREFLDLLRNYANTFAQTQLERVAQAEHDEGSFTVARKLRARAEKLAVIREKTSDDTAPQPA